MNGDDLAADKLSVHPAPEQLLKRQARRMNACAEEADRLGKDHQARATKAFAEARSYREQAAEYWATISRLQLP